MRRTANAPVVPRHRWSARLSATDAPACLRVAACSLWSPKARSCPSPRWLSLGSDAWSASTARSLDLRGEFTSIRGVSRRGEQRDDTASHSLTHGWPSSLSFKLEDIHGRSGSFTAPIRHTRVRDGTRSPITFCISYLSSVGRRFDFTSCSIQTHRLPKADASLPPIFCVN